MWLSQRSASTGRTCAGKYNKVIIVFIKVHTAINNATGTPRSTGRKDPNMARLQNRRERVFLDIHRPINLMAEKKNETRGISPDLHHSHGCNSYVPKLE